MSTDDDQRIRPYVGLPPFDERDREYFFGRAREQRIIISNVLASPLTILYGSSGVGKSSVLMAGVIPQLRRERPRTPVVMYRDWIGGDFRSALARACIEAVWKPGVDDPKPTLSMPLDEILRACGEAAHETVLVFFDQFEEYFLYQPKSTVSDSFEAQFARAVNREDVDVGFLISLREDGLSKLDRFEQRIPNLLSNRLRLEHLKPAGVTEAIRKPLEVWNEKHAASGTSINIEEGLVSELIEQLIGQVAAGSYGGSGIASTTDAGHIEAPFLQLVMVRLWDEEMGANSRVLRRETLDRLGGAKEIERTHLGDVMSRLEPVSQAVCATFFDRLVTPTGSKMACSADDLERWAGDLSAEVPKVLESLARDRILRTVAPAVDNPKATRYEIFHDILAPAILNWRRVYVTAQERQQAVEQAREQAEKRTLRRGLVLLATMTAIAIIGWVIAINEKLHSEAAHKATKSALREIVAEVGERGTPQSVLKAVEKLVRATPDDLARAAIYVELGKAWFHLGDFGRSGEFHEKADKIFEGRQDLEGEELVAYGWSLEWKGEQARNLSKLEKALTLHKEALKVGLRAGDMKLQAHSTAEIGAVYYWRGEYQKTLKKWKEALAISTKLGDQRKIAHYTIDVGFISFLRKDFDESLDRLDDGIKLAKKIGFADGQARGLMNEASVHFVRGKLKMAEDRYREALDISQKHDVRRLTWRIHHNIGNVLWKLGDPYAAKSEYDIAIKRVEAMMSSYKTEKERQNFIKHRLNPFRSMILLSLEIGDRSATEGYAKRGRDKSLLKYLARREESVDQGRGVKHGLGKEEQDNRNYFDGYYVETE